MESRYRQGIGPHPHTKLWVSYETESQGANVPLGLQYLLDYQRKLGHILPWIYIPGIIPIHYIVLTMADMVNLVVANLAYKYNNNPTANEISLHMASAGGGKHNDRINLEHLLANIPGNTTNGYPEYCRRVGVSQGSSIGIKAPHNNTKILDSKLSWFGSFQKSSCKGDWTWHIPHIEKNTTAHWWSSNNSNNLFDGGITLDGQVTIIPRICIKLFGGCWCIGPFNAGTYIVIAEKHVARPNVSTSRDYDDAPASTLASNVEVYKQSAYRLYNNLPSNMGYAKADNLLHSFCPTVSALDLRDINTGAPVNNFTSPQSLNLMNVRTLNNALVPEPNRRYGFPHLAYPKDHYKITPYDGVYAIGNNNGVFTNNVTRPYNQLHVEDPQKMIGDYLARFEVAPENLILTNRNLGETKSDYVAEFEARQKIYVGKTDENNENIYLLNLDRHMLSENKEFQVSQNSKAILHCGTEIALLPGTEVSHGANLEAYIQPYSCDNVLFRIPNDNITQNSQGSDLKNDTDISELKNIQERSNIKIVPNPNEGSFRIEGINDKAAELSLYDLTGKLLYTNKLTNDININLDHLENGIYLIVINTGKASHQRKLVITK